MTEIGAVIGGEGNGGVMLPDIHIGRDAPVAAALVLQLLAESNQSLSALKASLPQWHIVKLKASTEGISEFDKVSRSSESCNLVEVGDASHKLGTTRGKNKQRRWGQNRHSRLVGACT